MKKFILACGYLLFAAFSFAQTINQKLQKAFQQFESDVQLKHAISSLYVIDAKTGKAVFDKNSQIGLAPASTQKIITSVTAFELLGKGYKYKTEFYKSIKSSLNVFGTGDPTLGSWRYAGTNEKAIFEPLINKLRSKGYADFNSVYLMDTYDSKLIPSGWIYEDIGNYYGAGSTSLNWRENQYDIFFTPGGKKGDLTDLMLDTVYNGTFSQILNECKTGPVGSGDNAYIYFVPGSKEILIQGTIPAGVNRFTISGSNPEPIFSFSSAFIKYAGSRGVSIKDGLIDANRPRTDLYPKGDLLHTHYSPTLDSIIYWFNKKSINLYGEALIKTFAYEKKGFGSTDSGVAILKDFWKQKGIDEDELNISDGSGLSPQNRVTTHAQVEILKYARTRDWFPYFYNSLPDYNGMTMKSGTIKDVKGFCGYHKAKDGKEYIFSFLVNNYNGPSSSLVNKMYKVLDVLK